MSEGPQAVTLFREEALAARFQRAGSAIVIATPPSSRLVALSALAIAASIIGLTIWGQLTRTVTVSGMLVPERGVIRVFSPQAGIVVAKRLKFGDKVQRGQALYSVSSDRSGAEGAALAERVSAAIRVRIATLKTTIESTARLQAMELDRVTRQHDEIMAEMGVLASQNRLQADMVRSDRQVLSRKTELRASGVIPIDQLEQSQRQLAGDETGLLGLQGTMQKLRQSFADTQTQLQQLPLTGANQTNDLQRQLAFAEADLAENEMRREVVVVAPEDGTVSADLVEVGQTVTTGAAMAVIAPRDADLEAHLLVPSSGIGFIKQTRRSGRDALPGVPLPEVRPV